MSRPADRALGLVLTLAVVACGASDVPAGSRLAPRPIAAAFGGPELINHASASAVVNAHYGPGQLECPGRAVVIHPGQDLQAAVDGHRSGTSFCLRTGEYRLTTAVNPKPGNDFIFEAGATLNGSRLVTNWIYDGTYWIADGQTQSAPALEGVPCETNAAACEYEDLFIDNRPMQRVLNLAELATGKFFFAEAADKIYIVDDPVGHKLEATITGMAFDADGASDVTIVGATIEKFSHHGIEAGRRWRIEDSEIRFCHGHGLRGSEGTQVRGSYIHHNGAMGLFARGHGLVFDGNQLSYNNYLQFGRKGDNYWHAGATKVTGGSGTVLRRNWSHHNWGDGWWLDWDNIRNTIEDNVFEHNTRYGLYYEVSQAGVIRGNTLRGNEQGGLWVHTSRDVEVTGNDFDLNGGFAIGIEEADRGSSATHGRHRLANVSAHDNVVKTNRGQIGVLHRSRGIGAAEVRFERNRYYASDVTQRWWAWAGDDRTWQEWRSYGHDDSGQLHPLPARAEATTGGR